MFLRTNGRAYRCFCNSSLTSTFHISPIFPLYLPFLTYLVYPCRNSLTTDPLGSRALRQLHSLARTSTDLSISMAKSGEQAHQWGPRSIRICNYLMASTLVYVRRHQPTSPVESGGSPQSPNHPTNMALSNLTLQWLQSSPLMPVPEKPQHADPKEKELKKQRYLAASIHSHSPHISSLKPVEVVGIGRVAVYPVPW